MSIFARHALPRWALLMFLSVAGGSSSVWAQTDAGAPSSSVTAEAAPSAGEPLPDSWSSLGNALARTGLVLGLVVALIYLTLNLGLRRLMGVRAPPAGQKPVVAVLERVPLNQRHSLFVVRVAGDYLLLGSGDSGVSLLSRLNAEAMEQTQSKAQGSAIPFLEKLLSKRDVS